MFVFNIEKQKTSRVACLIDMKHAVIYTLRLNRFDDGAWGAYLMFQQFGCLSTGQGGPVRHGRMATGLWNELAKEVATAGKVSVGIAMQNFVKEKEIYDDDEKDKEA